MKRFHLKLLTSLLAFFGIVIAGMYLYEPFMLKWYEWELDSEDMATREEAAEVIAAKGEGGITLVKRWLNSSYDTRVITACLILEKMENEIWEKFDSSLMKILERDPSDVTDSAINVFVAHKVYIGERLQEECDRKSNLEGVTASEEARLRNYYCWTLSHNTINAGWAAESLAEMADPKSIPRLLEFYENIKDTPESHNVVYALSIFGDERCVDALGYTLKHDPNEVRKTFALKGLCRIGGRKTASILVELLLDEVFYQGYSGLYNKAGKALPGLVDASLTEKLIQGLKGGFKSNVRPFAARALGKINDPAATAVLREALESPPEVDIYLAEDDCPWNYYEVRIEAVWALTAISGKEAVDTLKTVLEKDSNSYVKLAALKALGHIGTPEGVKKILDVVKKSGSLFVIRQEAINAISLVRNRNSVPLLLAVFDDIFKKQIEVSTSEVCFEHENPSPGVLEKLIEDEKDIILDCVRENVCYALGAMSYEDAGKPILTFLKSVLYIGSDDAIETAVRALGEVKYPGSVDTLIHILDLSQDIKVRFSAIKALGEIGTPACVETLVNILQDQLKPEDQVRAASALGCAGGERAADVLLNIALESGNHELRIAAINALALAGSKRHVKKLADILEKSYVSSLNHHLVTVFAKYGDKDSLIKLFQKLKGKEDSSLHNFIGAVVSELINTAGEDALMLIGSIVKAEAENCWGSPGSAYLQGLFNQNKAVNVITFQIMQADYYWTDRSGKKPENMYTMILLKLAPEKLVSILGKARKVKDRTGILGGHKHGSSPGSYANEALAPAAALAWLKGGNYIEKATRIRREGWRKLLSSVKHDKDNEFEMLLFAAQLKWGKHESLPRILNDIQNAPYWLMEFEVEAFKTLPCRCPEFDIDAGYSFRKKQADVIKYWYFNNKHRLTWDAERRRYYLKPEGEKE